MSPTTPPARATPSPVRLQFLNSDIFEINTGGTLMDRDIVAELNRSGFETAIIYPALVNQNKRGWKPTLVGLVANLMELRRKFEKGSIVMISHGVYRHIWIAKWLWLLRFRIRIVYFLYHFDFNTKSGPSRVLRRLIEMSAVHSSERVFVISESGRRQAVAMGISSQCVKVIPIVRLFQPLPSIPARDGAHPCVFLFVGTVEPRKGLHIALEALAQLPQNCHCEVRIAGIYNSADVYPADLLRKASANSRFKISFLGKISASQLESEFVAADAFLFPSLWEGYGIAIEEALAHGLPVISTTAGSIPEIVRDGCEGWLVPPQSVSALSRAMEECILNKQERKERALRALARAKKLAETTTPGLAVRKEIVTLLATAVQNPPICVR